MAKVLVCDPISDEGVNIMKAAGIEVDVKTKRTEAEIIADVAEYDALIVRSETKITEAIINAATKLKVIGRAGVGVDNINVPIATMKGILVINSPDGNTISACEHTMGMMLSLARHIPQADQSLREHKWDRKKFTGIELKGKTLGILGFGKIGVQIAIRAKAFGMKVMIYDPYVTEERAAQFDVKKVDLEQIYKEADFITVHMPLNDSTRNMIAKEQLAMMKPTTRILNVARGGIINEYDLYEAVRDGVIAGAAVDVWTSEPMTENPLFDLPQVVVTPHLGASTTEAQVNVALDVVEEIRRVLNGEPVHTAVNIPFINPDKMEKAKPYMKMAENMGKIIGYLDKGALNKVEVSYEGNLGDVDTRSLTNSLLKGILRPAMADAVNYVNAPAIARERGMEVITKAAENAGGYVNRIVVTVFGKDFTHKVAGTVFENGEAHMVQIDDYKLDFQPKGQKLYIPHKDQPKVLGMCGMVLGENNVNIGGLQLGRCEAGGISLMIVDVDNVVDEKVLKQVCDVPNVISAAYIDFEN